MIDRKLLKKARGEEKVDLVLRNGRLIDVFNEELIRADLAVSDGIIIGTGPYQGVEEIDLGGQLVSPGFIDGHLHLESAMVRVEEFARRVIPLGTTTIVADPHEIANVAGIEGIKYLLEAGRNLPWNLKLMLPSCVPATPFETSGARLKAEDLSQLLGEDGIFGLGEVMDFPGVIRGDKEIWDKIALAGNRFKDGHSPGLRGQKLNSYLLAGIKADHECTTPAEALEKISKGMYIMIREGSVTRDLVSLLPAVRERNLSRFFLATDDRHPADLLAEGHINYLIKKSVKQGLNPLKALKLATINAALALGLEKTGALAPGYRADLVVIDSLSNFNVKMVFKDGKQVAEEGRPLFKSTPRTEKCSLGKIFQSIRVGALDAKKFRLPPGRRYRVMELVEDQVITKKRIMSLPVLPAGRTGAAAAITEKALVEGDLVKLAVVERHHRTGNVGLGLLKGFGLKTGAIATSISHDSHNIIVTGLNEEEMFRAVREIERMQGGLVIIKERKVAGRLALPIAGLMSEEPLEEVAGRLEELREIAGSLGVRVKAPFMTLSFMALSVIPELKLTDRGLFELEAGKIVPLVVESTTST